jgi:hypothetical protein
MNIRNVRIGAVVLALVLVASILLVPALRPFDVDLFQTKETRTSLATFGAGESTWTSFADPTNGAGDLLGMGAGEPTLGVAWNVGDGTAALFQAGPRTLRISFDDSVSPATATWEDVTPPLAAPFNNDPILFTDPQTGRTWAGGLVIVNQVAPLTVVDNTGCSILSYTDDNGQTWTPVADGCSLPGWDHESVTAGPWAGGERPAGALSDQAAYYCAQQVEKYCWVSYDGGQVFTPLPLVDPLLNCGQLFGKLRVASDGTLYMPINHCPITTGPTSVMVSVDNGLTWSIRKVTGSGSGGHFDPAVAVSLERAEGGASQRIYLGQAESDGAYVAVSDDRGVTWNDVGGGHGTPNKYYNVLDAFNDGKPVAQQLKRAEFAQMVAGDLDRAAFAFLGSTSNADPHDCADPTPVHEWHMYVAMTYDGGVSWTVTKTTTDPVQRGGIQSIGGATTGCRNLLDFNDVAMDAQGRVLVGYADGCTSAACKGTSGTPAQSTNNLATVTRQQSGRGLLAAFDSEDPDGSPKVTITSPAEGATVPTGTLTVSGGVDRLSSSTGTSSSSSSSSSSTSTSSSGTSTGPEPIGAFYFTDDSAGGPASLDCGTLASYRMEATVPTSTADGKAYTSRGLGPLGCPSSFVVTAPQDLVLEPTVAVHAWLGCDLPTAAPQDAAGSAVGLPYNVDVKLTVDGTDVPGAISSSGGTYLCQPGDAVPVEAVIPTGGITVAKDSVLGVTASAFWLTLAGDDPQPNLHFLVGSTGHPSQLELTSGGGLDVASSGLPGLAAGAAGVPSPLPGTVTAVTPDTSPPAAPQIVDPAGDAVDIFELGAGAPIDSLDIRSAWFREADGNLFIGLKVQDIPADASTTAQQFYSVSFKPDYASTWAGVPTGVNPGTFTGLQVTATLSPVDAGGPFPPSASVRYSLDYLYTTAAGNNYAQQAVLEGSIDADTDIVFWKVPLTELNKDAAGSTHPLVNDTLSALSAATGFVVGAGTLSIGDNAASAATYTFGGIDDEEEDPELERVELYEGTTLLGTDEVTTSIGAPTASWSLAGLELAPGSRTLTAKWFAAGVASDGAPLDSDAVTFSVGEVVDPCDTDATAPVLGTPAAATGETTATITWTTDESSTSVVHYGLDSSLGTDATTAGSATSHSVALEGLAPGTTYHFTVESEDVCGNMGVAPASGTSTFTTSEEAVEETGPFVSIDSPESNSELAASTVLVSGTAGHVATGVIEDSNGDGFVVIAVPDTGINPYHADFAASTYPRNLDADPDNDVDLWADPSTYLDGFPAGVPSLGLTIDGGYNAAADSAKFGAVTMGQLYRIPGTKIIGAVDISNSQPVNGAADNVHILDEDGHGTHSASVAAGNLYGSCKECLLVFIEGLSGDTWAFQQDWIDIVTTSGGSVANTPGVIGIEAGHLPTTDGQRDAAERGQSILYAGGNGCLAYVCPEQTYLSQSTGPEWTMDVGALIRDEAGDHQSIILSGKPVDISSFAAGDIPAACHNSAAGLCSHSGTSAATPRTAGHLGDMLLAARRALGDEGRIGQERIGGAGVVASGAPVAGSPYLDDGLLTRAELWHVALHAATPLNDWSGTVAIFPTGAPGTAASFAYAGYGTADDAMEARGIRVLLGLEAAADRPNEDAFFALDAEVRNTLYGTWDDDADTVETAAAPTLTLDALGLDAASVAQDADLLIDAFDAEVPAFPSAVSSACTGSTPATVSVYLDEVLPANLLGTDSLGGPAGACSDAWQVSADLTGAAYGGHALVAVYDDGLGETASTDIALWINRVQSLPFGEDLPISIREGTDAVLTLAVPTGARIASVTLTGPACPEPLDTPVGDPTYAGCAFDVDLYVRQGSTPTVPEFLGADSNDCSSASTSNEEWCDLASPAAGTWYVLLDSYAGSGTVVLRADLDLPDMDGDGVPDARDADRDGDGIDNDTELLVGTDPSSPELLWSPQVCIPVGSTGVYFEDRDGDGMGAAYSRNGQQVQFNRDGTSTQKTVSRCWLAGDLDDDGQARLPQVQAGALPDGSVCVPGAQSQLMQRDVDGDGKTAWYSRTHNSVLVVESGLPVLAPGPSYCWLAGDHDDDGVERLPADPPDIEPPAAPRTAVCVPGATSQLVERDVDGDGQTALYSRTNNRLVTIQEDGSVTNGAGPSYCWLAGDHDDDGVERLPADPPNLEPPGVPTVSMCAPGVSSDVVERDYDGDGATAYYARTGNSKVTASPDGVQRSSGPAYCWLAGDHDDDGVERAPAELPQSVCAPGAGTTPSVEDRDGDGLSQVYFTGDLTVWTVWPDGSVTSEPWAGQCQAGPDADDAA